MEQEDNDLGRGGRPPGRPRIATTSSAPSAPDDPSWRSSSGAAEEKAITKRAVAVWEQREVARL
ncbi:hypothetical protein ACIPPN_26990 [Streptomyces diastaticus]|uniref:hypothetical protein n=1 Tax=Streptomyces diastaticus TaxID=1956 RepID=UPI0037FEE973